MACCLHLWCPWSSSLCGPLRLTLRAAGDCGLSTMCVPDWKIGWDECHRCTACPSWQTFSSSSVPGAIVFVASWSLTLMAAGSWGWGLQHPWLSRLGKCGGNDVGAVVCSLCHAFSSPNVLGTAAFATLWSLTLTLMTAQGWDWGAQHRGCPRLLRGEQPGCPSHPRVLGAVGFVALSTPTLMAVWLSFPAPRVAHFARLVLYDWYRMLSGAMHCANIALSRPF